MAIIFLDGFESELTATAMGRRYPESQTGLPGTSIAGRLGGLAKRATALLRGRTGLLAPTDEIGLHTGISVRASNVETETFLLRLSNAANQAQIWLSIVPWPSLNGFKVKVARFANTEVWVSPTVFAYDEWWTLELGAMILSNNIDWEVRVQGFPLASGSTGANDTNAAGWSKAIINLGPGTLGGHIDADDVWAFSEGRFLGPSYMVEALHPNDRGLQAHWTRFPGGPGFNYQQVDDGATGDVDDDATYVRAGLSGGGVQLGKMDLYEHSNLAVINGSIAAVKALADARSDSTTLTALLFPSHEGGVTDWDESTPGVAIIDQIYRRYSVDLPHGWTPARLSLAQFGVATLPSVDLGGL
jgi:hypothetical protein